MDRTAWWIVLFSRILINLNIRITYPFLPAIARGLDISFEEAGILVAVRHCVGLSGFVFGWLSVRRGYFRGMQTGLIFLVAGCATVAWASHYATALAGFVLLGLAKAAYDPNIQALVSSRTSYRVRARAFGILESSWAGSWLVGVPLSGLLMARFGWRSPFFLLTLLAMVALVANRRFKNAEATCSPPTPSLRHPQEPSPPRSPSLARCFMILGASFFMVFANENLVMVYGAWMERSFRLELESLGLYSTLVGVAELAGELAVLALVDRWGKRRAYLGGLMLTMCAYAALPHAARSLFTALGAVTVMFLLFEFTIVTSFTYVSEWVPSRRGQWMAFNFCFLVAGRLAGALTAPRLWDLHHDLHLLAFVSLGAQLTSLVLLGMAGRGPKDR